MRSETQVRKELELTLQDLQSWRSKLEKTRDEVQRRISANTVLALEGRVEAMEWVLEGE